MRKKINNDNEFVQFLETALTECNQEIIYSDLVKNLEFTYEFNFPINSQHDHSKSQQLRNIFTQQTFCFDNCIFKKDFWVRSLSRSLKFKNDCKFIENLKLNTLEQDITLEGCYIKHLEAPNVRFGKERDAGGKVRIQKCRIESVNFSNTTFHNLVDFYGSTFIKPVIFYKTDFNNVLVLSDTTFQSNVLFTYSLLGDKIILRGTKFERGLDLSLTIIRGDLSLFNIFLKDSDYKAVDGGLSSDRYNDLVSEKGEIPISNKLETYRLLKVSFENEKNVPEALKYKRLEKKTYDYVLKKEEPSVSKYLNRFILLLNRKSNNYGTSIGSAFVFTLFIGFGFFYASFISTESYEFCWCLSKETFSTGVKYFTQFMIPTHKFDYMGDKVITTPAFYICDFFGRIFVGFGIYQFIQAFRKFR